jgi:hypothetical protein
LLETSLEDVHTVVEVSDRCITASQRLLVGDFAEEEVECRRGKLELQYDVTLFRRFLGIM